LFVIREADVTLMLRMVRDLPSLRPRPRNQPCGGDPLQLTDLFGISDPTAIR
jgi:hypothetical protein